MKYKKVIYGDEARSKLFNGFKAVNDVVKTSAGPCGRNTLIAQEYGSPKITKDGVSISKSVVLPDEEGEGAKMIIQASEKSNKACGDGTTNTCLIAEAIAEEGLKAIGKGVKSTEIKKGIDYAVSNLVNIIKEHSKTVETNDEVKQVATISANGDTEIGSMVAKAVETIGKNGVITVEEGKGIKTELEVVEGMQFDQGYLSPYFMTNPEKQMVEFDNPWLFMYDGKINTLQSILPLLEALQKTGRPIVLIADEFDDNVISTLVVNNLNGYLKCCAVKAPSFGDIRKAIMEDMAVLTGGRFISTQFGEKLEDLNGSECGSCAKIKISPTETVIINGSGSKESIDERVEQLTEEIENTESSYDKEKLRERIAKLTSGVAVIKVGGATEVEVKEKKDRVDDAVCATRAALEEGILPGGGVSLIHAVQEFKEKNDGYSDVSADMVTGVNLTFKAIETQLKTIVENAGKTGEVVLEKIKENSDFNYGYDVFNDKYVNMVETGIIDATKVVRCALENGASVAGTLLTVESIVIDDVEENAKIMSLFGKTPQVM